MRVGREGEKRRREKGMGRDSWKRGHRGERGIREERRK